MLVACRRAFAVLALCAASATGAAAQSLPTLQEYPLRDRVFGSGGAFFPDYVTPSYYGITYMTGTGAGTKGAIFAAGTTDYNCQQTQVPTIKVLSAPPRGRVTMGYGSFVATGRDGGAMNPCMGRTLKGVVVRYKGPSAPGDKVTLRVTYPTMGAWYDHVVPVSGR